MYPNRTSWAFHGAKGISQHLWLFKSAGSPKLTDFVAMPD